MTSPQDIKCFWCKFSRADHYGSPDFTDGNLRCPTEQGYSRKWTFLPIKVHQPGE